VAVSANRDSIRNKNGEQARKKEQTIDNGANGSVAVKVLVRPLEPNFVSTNPADFEPPVEAGTKYEAGD
jgi:hypothetical protein